MSRRRVPRGHLRLAAIVLLLLAAAAGVAAGATGGGAGAAQANDTIENRSPYYANHSDSVPNESWMEGNANATAPAIVTMLSRVGTFVIGGDGGSGPLLFGMVLLGAALSFVVSAPVGLIGGSVLTVTALFGVVSVGLAPQWFTAVAMFGVGLLLASAARRVMR